MGSVTQGRCSSFIGTRLVASGDLMTVVLTTKEVIDKGVDAPILIFDDVTSEQIEVDFRGNAGDVLKRLSDRTSEALPATTHPPEQGAARGPGRPRLGVVAREVTLLPRHWEWLNDQPGGASVALRKLVEEARRANEPADRVRRSRESAYRFLSTMAGNLSGFEEATRALFAGKQREFDEVVESWPKDVRDHAKKLVAIEFQNHPET